MTGVVWAGSGWRVEFRLTHPQPSCATSLAASKSSPASPAAALIRAPPLRGSARGGSEDPRTQQSLPGATMFPGNSTSADP